MRHILKTIGLAIACLLFTAPAYAGIPIPCTGETIVKVLDIDSVPGRKPGIPGLIDRPIDLGYKFSGCGNGKWVGYTGDSRRYLDLPEPVLKLLLLKAGRSKFPPAPSFMGTFSASWVVWMYIVLFIPAVVAGIFGKKPAPARAANQDWATQDGTNDAPATAVAPAAPGMIGSARSVPAVPVAATRVQAPLGPNVAAATRTTSRSPTIQSRLGGQPSFGRRA